MDQGAHQVVDFRVGEVAPAQREGLAEQVVQPEVAQRAGSLALADALEPAAAAEADQDLDEPQAVPPPVRGLVVALLSGGRAQCHAKVWAGIIYRSQLTAWPPTPPSC